MMFFGPASRLAFGVLGFPMPYLYLRRALQYLDPRSVIPQRVRAAFDSLGEGVVILDAEERVMLTNRVFKALHPEAAADLIGRRISTLSWLLGGMDPGKESYPWRQAMKTRSGTSVEPPASDAGVRRASMTLGGQPGRAAGPAGGLALEYSLSVQPDSRSR